MKTVKKIKKKDGMIILEMIVLHNQYIEMMQHEKQEVFYWTGCPQGKNHLRGFRQDRKHTFRR